MKLCIPLVLLFAYMCHGSEIWYQADMSTYLVPPFQNAYAALQQNIINQLSAFDSQSLATNDGTLAAFSSNLYCAVEKMLQQLDTSVTASISIRNKVDYKLMTIANDIAIKEQDIARLDNQARSTNDKIRAKQSQINAAEQSMRQAENSVADAENSLRRAEQEVEDAKLCAGLFGRRKRFLGNIWNSIQNSVLKPLESAVNSAGNAIGSAANTVGSAIESAVNSAGEAIVENVVKPVCSVINYQQVDNSRRNVENKKNELAFFRNQVQTLRNELNSVQNELTVFNAQLFNLNAQLNEMKNSLTQLPNEQHIILSINQKLTDLVSYVRSRISAAKSFADAITAILTVDSVVKSMNAVYDELHQNQFMRSSGAGKILVEQVNQAIAGLQSLTNLMTAVGFTMQNTRCAK